MHVSLDFKLSCFLSMYVGMKLLSYRVSGNSAFGDTAKQFSHSQTMYECSGCSTHAHEKFIFFFILNILVGIYGIIVGFRLHFLNE